MAGISSGVWSFFVLASASLAIGQEVTPRAIAVPSSDAPRAVEEEQREVIGPLKASQPEDIQLRGVMAMRGHPPAALLEVEETFYTIVQGGSELREVSLRKGRVAILRVREIKLTPPLVEIAGPGGLQDPYFYLSLP